MAAQQTHHTHVNPPGGCCQAITDKRAGAPKVLFKDLRQAMKTHLAEIYGVTPVGLAKAAYLMNHSPQTHDTHYGRVEDRATKLYGPALVPDNATPAQKKLAALREETPEDEDGEEVGSKPAAKPAAKAKKVTKPVEKAPIPPEENIVEGYVKKQKSKKGQVLYLVKWQGYAWNQAGGVTWEPAIAVPGISKTGQYQTLVHPHNWKAPALPSKLMK